jgi:hypothetical protein
MEPKSSSIIVLKFSNTGPHKQLEDSANILTPWFFMMHFNITYVTIAVSCFHYSDQNNALISHMSVHATCPPISPFLTLLS